MPEADAALTSAFAAIDAANAVDPLRVEIDGTSRPKELVHAERALHWLLTLDPDADRCQQVAVRAHHLRRWVEPRTTYPEGRAGYLRWRKVQKARHAAEASAILEGLDWDQQDVASVAALIRKDGLGADPRAQAHEDALCLTFLELQLDELLEQLGDDRATTVLARTARKMSADALALAATLPLSARGRGALERAGDAG